MKHSYFSRLAAVVALLLITNLSVNAQTTYSSPGTYTFTVSTGIYSIAVDAMGAVGGSNYSNGGYGGRVICTLAVYPGEVLYVNVGGAGGNGSYWSAGSGGYNGGANCTYRFGAGGGGGTDIMVSPYTLNDRVICAGGGGGAGYDCGGGDWGGNGGDLNGQSGAMCYSYYNGGFTGYGGDQYSGGSGAYYGASSGYQGWGGDGSGYGGGGGGGYYGGGGGYYGGGGGGSSYTDPGSVTNVTHYQGYNGGDGYVSLTEICGAGDITGSPAVCVGSVVTLAIPSSGGAWSTDDAGIADVNPSTGDVTGMSAGTTNINYTVSLACGTVTSSFTINVADVPTPIAGSTNICQNQTVSYSSSGGGNWSSNDNSIATIDPYSGVAYGVNPGATTITYQVGSSCYVTQNVTVLQTAAITGTTNVCAGLTTTLNEPLTGGTWVSGNTGLATINSSTGLVTGVVAGFPTISYTQTNGCIITTPFTVNPLPAAFTGPTAVCQGQQITVGESSTGGTWSSSNTTQATATTGSSTTGTVKGISGPSTPTITYKLPTGCIMTSAITVNPLPALISSTGSSCVTDINNPVVTLYDATGTGAWSSSNTNVATIVSFSGDVTGVGAGTLTMSYTLPTGCYVTTPYTINPLPEPISGTKVVCANATTYLADVAIGGNWTSSNTGFATIGSGTGIVTGVSGPTNPIISYTLPTGCLAVTTLTVNAAPGAISGTPAVCVGSTTNLVVGGGGTWASSNTSFATVTPGPIGGGVVTGVFTGTPLITYTLPVTGCFSTTAVTVNPVPAPITGAAGVCYGLTTTLNDATGTGVWSSSLPGIASVSGSGVVTALSSVGGTTNIDYTLSTGCKATQVVTVNPLPINYTLGSGGITNYCAGGAGIDLQMNVSTTGVNYQLYNGGVAVGTPLPGTAGILDFGFQTAAGVYTAIATDATTGCVNNMVGSPVINIDPVPTIYNLSYVGTSSNYCDVPGAPGIDVVLSGSQPGFIYTLNINGSAGPVAIGTGSAIDFGFQNALGVYTAVANDPSTPCVSNMTGTFTIGKSPLPAVNNVTVTDGGNYCAGGIGVHVGLDYANTGIDYQLWNGGTLVTTKSGANSALDFGLQTVAGTYTVIGINAITNCSNNMNGSAVVTINPLPALYPVSVIGSSSYCVGGTGVHITLTNSENSINYQLYNGAVPVGPVMAGASGTPIDFGFVTATGTYTVLATNPVTGCNLVMTGSASVATYPAMSVYNLTVSGGGSYCAGGAGLHLLLSGSATGVKYDLWNAGSIVATRPGTGSSLDFGLQTLTGSYTVVATNSTTGCTANMAGSPSITINTLPSVYNVTVTNSGFYCAGSAGVSIGLNFSDIGINYQLYRGLTAIGAPKAGSSASLDFGLFTTPGIYTIVGTNTATTCSSNMSGSPVVTVNPVPVAYPVTGGGSYCAGGTGVPVGVANSSTGINYQLLNTGTPVATLSGTTGSSIDFGAQTATGMYTVVGTDAVTGCTNNMTGSKVITVDPAPTSYTVTGGGQFCAGGTGVNIGLSGSTTGITYKLMNGATVVRTVPGITGTLIDFGPQTIGGIYTVVATNTISGCTANMANSVTVTVNAQPLVYTVNGGGHYCASGAGTHIGLSGSDAGISYQPYIGATAIGSPVIGTGVALDLGLQTVPGTYKVVATNLATGCTKTMASTTDVVADPLPVAFTTSGGGKLCAGGVGFNVYLGGSASGISYQLYNGAAAVGTAMTGTGAALDFGKISAAGIYTIKATDASSGCVNNMLGNAIINVNPAPNAFAMAGGGNYCTGGAGVLVGTAGSDGGINYQLYLSATAIGSPVGGTGGPLSFGLQTGAGIYTVVASNPLTGCTNTMTGTSTVAADPVVAPVVTIGGSNGTACVGAVTTYSATPTFGGTTPSFEWKVGASVVGTGNTYAYIPLNGDVVSVTMTSSAACVTTPIAANSMKMNVIPYEMPTAAVMADPGYSVCHGTPVTFAATTTAGGSHPTFTWLKNSAAVGGAATSFSYVPNTGNNGDVITFRLISDYQCRMADTVFSTPIVMIVDSAMTPSVKVTSHLGPIVGVGQVDTFTATVTNAGNSLINYQWYVNGTEVSGATSALFINHDVYNQDHVSCLVTRPGACGAQTGTDATTVDLHNLGTKVISGTRSDIAVVPNPNKGEFTVKGTLGTNSDEEVSLEITNMLGQVVYSNKVMAHNGNINQAIKLSNTIANGMYMLNLRSESANNVFHIVIEQ